MTPKDSNRVNIYSLLGVRDFSSDTHWLRGQSNIEKIIVDLRDSLLGLTRPQIAEIFSGIHTKQTAGTFVRDDFQKDSLLKKAQEIPFQEKEEEMHLIAAKVADALNPVTGEEGENFALFDLSQELQAKKLEYACGVLRASYLLVPASKTLELTKLVEQHQKDNFYRPISEVDSTLIPLDRYYGTFVDMLQYGLGVAQEEAVDLEIMLSTGFTPEREAELFHAKMMKIKGYYKTDDFSPQSKEKLDNTIASFFVSMSITQREQVLKSLKEQFHDIVRDLRGEIMHLPPSEAKKQLMNILKGREIDVWDEIDNEALAAL